MSADSAGAYSRNGVEYEIANHVYWYSSAEASVLPTPSAPPTTRTAPFFKSVEVCPVRGVGSEPVNCEACEAGAYNSHEANTVNSGASGPEKISTPPEIKSVAFGNSVTVGLVRIAPMLPTPANVSEAGSKASMLATEN